MPSEISIDEQIKEVKREIGMRRRVYPKWNGGVMSEKQQYQIRVMEAVLASLEKIKAETSAPLFD